MKTFTIIVGLAMLCPLAMGANSISTPLIINDVNISTEAEARQIARDSYTEKMGTQLMAEEGVRQIDVITIGYDVPKFAERGEVIWEVRIMAFFDRELRAILWINPRTEKVHYVCGPWDGSDSRGVTNKDSLGISSE